MRGRWLLLALALALVLLAAGAGWIYAHPPLKSFGMAERHDGQGNTLAYGIELENTGRWPLTLTAVQMDGREFSYPWAMAVANFTDSELASSAAIRMEECGHKLETGPVKGWKIQPDEPRGGSYALRIDWEGMPAPPAEVVVHYRYLGLPMQYSVPWMQP